MVSAGHAVPASRSGAEALADLVRGIAFYGILAIGLGTPFFAIVYKLLLR